LKIESLSSQKAKTVDLRAEPASPAVLLFAFDLQKSNAPERFLCGLESGNDSHLCGHRAIPNVTKWALLRYQNPPSHTRPYAKKIQLSIQNRKKSSGRNLNRFECSIHCRHGTDSLENCERAASNRVRHCKIPSYFVNDVFLLAGIIRILANPQGIVAKTEVSGSVQTLRRGRSGPDPPKSYFQVTFHKSSLTFCVYSQNRVSGNPWRHPAPTVAVDYVRDGKDRKHNQRPGHFGRMMRKACQSHPHFF
jgi:hypothetical protein